MRGVLDALEALEDWIVVRGRDKVDSGRYGTVPALLHDWLTAAQGIHDVAGDYAILMQVIVIFLARIADAAHPVAGVLVAAGVAPGSEDAWIELIDPSAVQFIAYRAQHPKVFGT